MAPDFDPLVVAVDVGTVAGCLIAVGALTMGVKAIRWGVSKVLNMVNDDAGDYDHLRDENGDIHW